MGLFANLDLDSSFSPVGPFEAESVIKTKESRTRLLIFDRICCEFRNDAALLIAYLATSGLEREDQEDSRDNKWHRGQEVELIVFGGFQNLIHIDPKNWFNVKSHH